LEDYISPTTRESSIARLLQQQSFNNNNYDDNTDPQNEATRIKADQQTMGETVASPDRQRHLNHRIRPAVKAFPYWETSLHKPLHESCSSSEGARTASTSSMGDSMSLYEELSPHPAPHHRKATSRAPPPPPSTSSRRNSTNSLSLSSALPSPIESFTPSDSCGEQIISQRLLSYGIVPMQKKVAPKDKVPPSVKQAADEVHRWLFLEGGHFEDVESFMTNYCLLVRKLGIPVDRLYYGGIGLHPQLTAYLWKWEPNDFTFREMPQEVFERRHEIFGADEPFCVLETGQADFIRIRRNDMNIPSDTAKWFCVEHYQDYFALPDIHRNQFKGGLAWASKDSGGFSNEHISFLELTLPALTTIMRLHTSDLVLRTLTEKMEREIADRTKELAQVNHQLETQGKKQMEHFACMSHEIRTPLNCIVGLSSVILTEELTPSIGESVRMINSSAELLNAVVDDVLDYAKMESGVFQVDIRETSLQETLGGVVATMQQKVADKGIRIHTHYGTTLPEFVHTDPRRLQQVFYNLLGNAGKFSKSGGVIDLTAGLENKSEHEQVLKFSIKDYGKGIHTSAYETIFQPFCQANKETHTAYGGTGLGLAITSKLVRRLGGRIYVDSKVDEYAEFIVEIPFIGKCPDVQAMTRDLRKTTLILFEDEKAPQSHHLTPEVVVQFQLDIIKVCSWEQLNQLVVDIPGKFPQDRHYVLLAPSTCWDRRSYTIFANSRERVSLVMHGLPMRRKSRKVAAHWHSFQNMFAISVLQSIIGIVQESKRSIVASPWETLQVDDLLPSPCTSPPCRPKPKRVTDLFTPNSPKPNTSLHSILDDSPISSSSSGRSNAHAKRDHSNFPPPNPKAFLEKLPTRLVSKAATIPLRTLKILYAEDNKINQKVMERMLDKLGIVDLDMVDNGLKAVEISAKKQYDIIFMDISMPVMDGLVATRCIKDRDGDKFKTKIIYCTAHAVGDVRLRAEATGGDGFISKPFNIKKIEAILNESSTTTAKCVQ
jgi:signal transduction histidine kinase/ActR/RegA family two-component response regulator